MIAKSTCYIHLIIKCKIEDAIITVRTCWPLHRAQPLRDRDPRGILQDRRMMSWGNSERRRGRIDGCDGRTSPGKYQRRTAGLSNPGFLDKGERGPGCGRGQGSSNSKTATARDKKFRRCKHGLAQCRRPATIIPSLVTGPACLWLAAIASPQNGQGCDERSYSASGPGSRRVLKVGGEPGKQSLSCDRVPVHCVVPCNVSVS